MYFSIVYVVKTIVCWIWIGLLARPEVSSAAEAVRTRQSILTELLKSKADDLGPKHDPKISPDFELDTPTKVKVRLFIQNIHTVSESSMDYFVDLLLRQTWIDSRLIYAHLSNATSLELDNKLMDQVWIPDTYFTNEKQGSVHHVTVPNKMMHLHGDGSILYSMRLSLRLACMMDLQHYPMDSQLCPIELGSYGYSTDNIVYQWEEKDPVGLLNDVTLPQYSPSVHSVQDTCGEAQNEVGQFSCIRTYIQLQREMGHYMVQVFIPSILIVALSWVSFWVDHDAVPARISLGVLTVLTMTTQSSGSRQSLPQVSYVKAIDVWMFTCLVFVFVALLEYSYVNVVARRRLKLRDITINVKTDESLKQPLEKPSANKKVFDGQHTEDDVTTKKGENAAKQSDLQARRVDKISRFIFPAAFLIFNIVFWTLYKFLPE